MFERIIRTAFEEDLGEVGDITTDCIISDEIVKFSINSREWMVVSGLAVAFEIFIMYGQGVCFNFLEKDGNEICAGQCIVDGEGKASVILTMERVLLNFMQRASGISSRTREFVNAVSGTKAKIRSTRKTSPGLRNFDIYAVGVGGGETYRRGLYDGIMIKDNHIASCGSITECVSRVRKKLGDVLITVECDNTLQVEESVSNSIDAVLLDNMEISEIYKSIEIVNKSAVVEVSGGVNIGNIGKIAETGVDYISVGSITNSYLSKDMGLDIALSSKKS